MAYRDPETDPTDPASEKDKKEEEPLTWRGRLSQWVNQAQFLVYTVLVVALITLGFLWQRMFVTIQPGHHGVMYRFLAGGTVTDRIWGEGLQVIPPWDRLTIYETRLQQQTLKFDVLSEEGLALGVIASVRYRPRQDMLGFLHQDIGADYFERVIKPEVQAHVRRTFGSRPAHEIYSSARDVLQELGRVPEVGRVEDTDVGVTARSYVEIQELKLLDVKLPDVVTAAIAEKYRQEQLMLEYRYKLEREEKEAERKRTEAAGIRDFNLIAAKVSPDLLRWRGVDATLELAKSPNTKVVVLGAGQGNNPVLINLVDSPSGPPPANPAATDTASSAGGNEAYAARTATGATIQPPQTATPEVQTVAPGAPKAPSNASEQAKPSGPAASAAPAAPAP
ncbi:prohibitin family protein [Chondromyces crocatus]|uniref:Band 7 domain-containing protein n=1 Tax=Chondromyces crocatus TaxID=52 RepID=A0A0K1ERA1_CHOCO|nr:prohibitin family protein [Chondromyces crocatus]AKT43460.1 uncharacterized protein CMC5_076920 [Chondromyces crocatus]